MRHLCPLALLVLAAPAAAQTGWTSPRVLATVDGDSDRRNWLASFASPTSSHEHALLDNTNLGPARTIRWMSWRRDAALGAFADAFARDVHVAVRMVHADYTGVRYNRVSRYPPSFFRSAWVEVIADRKVSMPDWRPKPARSPAPWTIKLPLDRPFVYDGKGAMITNWKFWNPDPATVLKEYPVDYERGGGTFAEANGKPVGTGCRVTGHPSPMVMGSGRWRIAPPATGYPPSELRFSVFYAPRGAPAVAFFGASRDVRVPGVCANSYTSMLASLGIGSISGSGSAIYTTEFRHRADFVGTMLSVQVVALDSSQPGLPVAASNGFDLAAYPPPPVVRGEFAQSYVVFGYRGARPPGGWPWGNSMWFRPSSAIPVRFE